MFKKKDSRARPIADKHYPEIDRALERYQRRPDALLEILHAAQEAFGYLSADMLEYIAQHTGVPFAEVYGVATFYHLFSFDLPGEHNGLICTDPACLIAGAEDLLAAAQRHAHGNHRIRHTTCLGLCDQSPAALINNTACVKLTAENIAQLFDGSAARARIHIAGAPRIITRHIGALSPLDLDTHRKTGAFSALEKALREMTPEAVIEQVKLSGMAGRGGAGFPTGLKWQFTRAAADPTKYIVCNFDESEPGTFKDRCVVEGDPFRVIEGIILAGYAIGATQGYIFVRGEYPEAAGILQAAIDTLIEANLLGKSILGSTFDFDLAVRRGAGAYICGEETALFEAVEGKQGFPRIKPPFPTTNGLFDKPTAINNVETLALIPDIVRNGGQWLKQWGTEKSVGVKLFCLSGHVKQPGLVEAPYGLTVRELIERYGGGFSGEPQAILMGGAAGGFLHPDDFDTPLTNETLNPLGTPIGSGVIMVFNQDVDLLHILGSLMRFFVHESCGKCVPCRVGTTQMANLLDKIASGRALPDDVDQLERLAKFVKRASLCGLGQSAPNALLSTMRYFRHEYTRTAGASANQAAGD